MRRSDLAHIVRAASRIVDESDVVIIGSQAILGSFDEHELPRQATFSREADVAFWDDDDEIKSDRVDGAIGEGSQFDASFGYYGQGVSISTAILPEGWRDRLVPLESPETRPGRGWCLEPHDLALSKLVAGREKDHVFVSALLEARIVDPELLRGRAETLPIPALGKRRISRWIDACVRRLDR